MILRLFAIVAAFLLCSNTYAQTPSSCTPSALLRHSYQQDAEILALRRIYALHSPDTVLVGIPARYTDSIMAGLASICNTGSAIQADSVFDAYCIHIYNYIPPLTVGLDTSYLWTNAWRLRNTNSGNLQLDTLMLRYGFAIDDYGLSYDGYFAKISNSKLINLRAFADSLMTIAGVRYVTIDYPPVVESEQIIDIYYSRLSNATFTFYLGWYCWLCHVNKQWQYEVDNTCAVTFSGIPADPSNSGRPTPPYCHLHPLSIKQDVQKIPFDSYPNPVQDILHISLTSTNSISRFRISNLYGQLVVEGMTNATTTINVTQLPAGIYVLQLGDEAGMNYRKTIIKE